MSKSASASIAIIEAALAKFRLPASRIDDQIRGSQIARATSGSPGVVDRDDIPSNPGDIGAEPALGNPVADDYLLNSSAAGVRLWVPATTIVARGTHGGTEKTTPIDADEVPLADSAASYGAKKMSWANIKATIKTYFDTLYAAITHTHAATDIASGILADARLSSNVPLLNAANTFSSTQTINPGRLNITSTAAGVATPIIVLYDADATTRVTFSAVGAGQWNLTNGSVETGQILYTNVGTQVGIVLRLSDATERAEIKHRSGGGITFAAGSGSSAVDVADVNLTGINMRSGKTYQFNSVAGITATVTLAKVTTGGSNGALTISGGIVTAYTAPT